MVQEKRSIREYRYLFGPVPSRRLGLSLGLDLLPPKTCTLDCLYCEVGRTTNLAVDRFDLNRAPEILEELEHFLATSGQRLDYVTMAGSGEPTLNAELGRIIRGVKAMTPVKVCVLTNGTLLHREDVRRDLAEADLVSPSLDTVNPDTFRRLNRPHPDLDLPTIIQGLVDFRAEFSGQIWLEILLSAGINDSWQELKELKAVAAMIQPDRIQINTVYRPPAYVAAKPITAKAMADAARFFGPTAEVVGRFSQPQERVRHEDLHGELLSLLGRRPCTLDDMAESLGLDRGLLRRSLEELEQDGRIVRESFGEDEFFRRVERSA